MTVEAARVAAVQNSEPKDHNLVADAARETISKGVHYEKRPVKGADGKPVAGLFNAWITLDNQSQFNSYTTDMVKATILAFRAASAIPISEAPPNTMLTPTRSPMAQSADPGSPAMMKPASIRSTIPEASSQPHRSDSSRRCSNAYMMVTTPSARK